MDARENDVLPPDLVHFMSETDDPVPIFSNLDALATLRQQAWRKTRDPVMLYWRNAVTQ